MTDVFAVQEEIAASIVGALHLRVSADERARLVGRPTGDLEAYDLYLKGRHVSSARTRAGLEEAIADYQRAAERDPRFALAYAGLADAYVNMSNFNFISATEGLARAKIAAERALALDSSLAEAYASQGFVLASNLAFAESEAAFRRAIALNPSYSWAHHYYTLLLMMLGRANDATEHERRALELDPLSLPANANRGILLCLGHDYVGARRELRRALTLSANFALALHYLGALEAADKRYAEALPLLERAHRNAPGFPGVIAALAYTYQALGRRGAVDSVLAELPSDTMDERSRINRGLAEAVLGRVDRAFTILEPAKWDLPTLIELRTDPLLAPLRADARYGRLLAKLGLAP